VIDEADLLLRNSGDSIIHDLTRINEGNLQPHGAVSVSLCLISQQYLPFMLTSSRLGTFGNNKPINLNRYSHDELQTIITQRVKLAYMPGTIDTDCIELIADIAAPDGDARYAIELLWRAGLLAIESGDQRVTAEHVRGAKAFTNPNITGSLLQRLKLHEQLVLLAIARALKGQTYTCADDVLNTYAVVSEEYDERPRGRSQFWQYVNHLVLEGLVDTKPLTKTRGRKRAVSIPDVPVEELEIRLVELLDARMRANDRE
jgi:cell division control protein 6